MEMNRIVSNFFYASGLIFIYSLILFSFIKKIPLPFRGFFLFPFAFLFNDIADGFELMWHTESFFYPELSTFSWNNLIEYHKYLSSNLIIHFFLGPMIILGVGYFYTKRLKAKLNYQGGGKVCFEMIFLTSSPSTDSDRENQN